MPDRSPLATRHYPLATGFRTDRYDATVAAVLEEAHRERLVAIARIQDLRSRRIVVDEQARIAQERTVGLGVQVFTREGWCGFAASDDLSPATARDLVRSAGRLARASGPLGPETSHAVAELPAGGPRVVPRRVPMLESMPPSEQLRRLREANGAVRGSEDRLVVRSRCSIVDDEWRIVRTDGTDVSFALPRATVRHDVTARAAGDVLTVGATVAGDDGDALLRPESLELLERRARRALHWAREARTAPHVTPGSYRLAIDYTLAKGLAHETFGHACETDVAPISSLAVDGRLRLGDVVGPERVSIVDEPIPGDFADQPISANGLDRRPVEIVRQGVLASGLGDLFSARRAGSPMTGACRAASYRERPTPRMTNTRIVVADPLPLPVEAEVLEPEEVIVALQGAGLWSPGEPFLYLVGYRGGQAHPSDGDFMFACAATYDLGAGGAPRQPAIFSGKAVAALEAIVAGFGDLHLDAAGTCSKNGRNASSSGGSHTLLVLDAHPDVTVGGAA